MALTLGKGTFTPVLRIRSRAFDVDVAAPGAAPHGQALTLAKGLDARLSLTQRRRGNADDWRGRRLVARGSVDDFSSIEVVHEVA